MPPLRINLPKATLFATGPTTTMKKILVNLLQFLFFLGIGSGILFLVFRSQNQAYEGQCCLDHHPEWAQVTDKKEKEALIADCRASGFAATTCPPLMDKLVADFKTTKFGWIGLVLLAFVVSNISRTYKWQMLLVPMGYRPRFINGFLSILVGYFANLGLPRMGEVVRAGLLSRYEKIPAEKVMGTIVVDRVIDVICLLLAFLTALLFESEKILGYIQEKMGGEAESGSSKWPWVLGGMALAAFLFYALRKKIGQSRFYLKLQTMLKGFWEGLLTVRKLERPGLFIFHSLNIWVLFFVMTWLGFKAFGPVEHLGLRAALTVFVFGTLGFVIPSPGGMGTFHALVIAALTLFYDIRGDDAFSMANIIFFSVQIGFNSILGLISLLLLPMLNRGYKGASPASNGSA